MRERPDLLTRNVLVPIVRTNINAVRKMSKRFGKLRLYRQSHLATLRARARRLAARRLATENRHA